MSKTHWKKAFTSNFLSSSDIENESLKLTIENVRYEECVTASGKKPCNVAHFTDISYKPMILNVGNAKIVKKFAKNSTFIEDWNNIEIEIYVNQNVRFGKETVEGLRIKPVQPTKKAKLTVLTVENVSKAIAFLKEDEKTMEDLKKFYSITSEIEAKIVEGLK